MKNLKNFCLICLLAFIVIGCNPGAFSGKRIANVKKIFPNAKIYDLDSTKTAFNVLVIDSLGIFHVEMNSSFGTEISYIKEYTRIK